MTVEVKISFDPAKETFEHALAALAAKPAAATLMDGTPFSVETITPEAAPERTEAVETPTAPAVTKTDIRAIATALSKAGKKAELKAAFDAFGAAKLSDINEADYPALKKKLEEIDG